MCDIVCEGTNAMYKNNIGRNDAGRKERNRRGGKKGREEEMRIKKSLPFS